MIDFTDEELKEIFDCLKKCKKIDDIINLINEKISDSWILYESMDYSNDYPHLRRNWENICKQVMRTPKKIFIVEEINQKVLLHHILCERLTREGCIVRIKEDLILCNKCNKALPSKDVYNIMKTKGNIKEIPDFWNNKCSNC